MSVKLKQGPQHRSEAMRTMIEAWRISGQSQQQFCKSQGISPKTFGYWVRKFRNAVGAPGGFVSVSAPEPMPGSSVFVRLRLVDGVELSFEQAVSSAYLRSLLGW